MRHVRLVTYDDEHGNLGFIVKGTPIGGSIETMADIEGGLIAHDLLEHQNGTGRIGCPADELEAMGGLWQVRGRHGDFAVERSSFYSPTENVGWNIFTVGEELFAHHWEPQRGEYRTQRHDCDEEFEEIITFAREKLAGEIWNEGTVSDEVLIDAFCDNALHLMRRGYRKAQRRFGSGYEGIDTFKAIKRAVRAAHRQVVAEGQEFTLGYGGGNARCYEVFEGE